MPDPNDDCPPEIQAAVAEVANDSNSDILFYAGDIAPPYDKLLLKQARESKSRPNALLMLTTNGGDPDAAFRLARGLQDLYKDGELRLFVGSCCKSAGTLIALGADELVMSDGAELGPLDIQLSKPDELAEQISGLIPIQALNTLRQQVFQHFEDFFLKLRLRSSLQITTRTAADIAAQLTTGLFQPVYQQLDPMRLGEIQRAMMIGHEYGERLCRRNVKDGGLNKLIAGYPSHGFIIDRSEAEMIFRRVRQPNESEVNLVDILDPLTQEGMADEPMIEFLSEPQTEVETNGTNQNPGAATAVAGTSTEEAGPDRLKSAGYSVSKPSGPARVPEGQGPHPNGQESSSMRQA